MSPSLLNSFLFSDPKICYPVSFSVLGAFDYVVVSVSIDFPLKRKCVDAIFNCEAFGYSWHGFQKYVQDCLWEDILNLGAFAATSKFFKWDLA